MAAEEEQEEIEFQVLFEGDEEPIQFITKDGKGKATYPNGDTYEGVYLNGMKNGEGTYIYNEQKTVYCGNWKDGKKDGKGKFKFSDGSLYQGFWLDNKRNGKGSYYYANGDVYTGDWKKGLKEGFGTYIYVVDGSQLTGQWGEGKYLDGEWAMGSGDTKFTGKFNKDGQPEGKGTITFQVSDNIAHVEEGIYSEKGLWIAGKQIVSEIDVKESSN